MLAGFDFDRVFLRLVAQGLQGRLAESGVVVGVDLAVERDQLAGFDDRQRIQFDQGQILLVVQPEQAKHQLGQMTGLLGGQAHLEAELAALVGHQAGDIVDRHGMDGIGIFLGDLLDLDPALG